MRGVLKRGFMGLIVALAFFLLLEGGLRLVFGPPAPARLIRKVWAAEGQAFAIEGGKATPTYQGIDAIAAFDVAPTPAVVRIAGFGESSMHGGSGLPVDREFMGLIGKTLTAEGERVEVLNLARPGLDSHTNRAIVAEGMAFHPDIVMFYMGHNDIGNGMLEARYGTIQSAAAAHLTVGLEQFQLYVQLQHLLVPHPNTPQARPGLTPTQREVLEIDFRSNLRRMVYDVKRAGATPILITPASPLDGWFPTGPSCSAAVPVSAWQRRATGWTLYAERLTSAQIDYAISAAPDCPDVMYLRGIKMLREGKRDEAWRALAAARDLEPASTRASSGIVAAVRQVADEEEIPLVDWEAWLRTGTRQSQWFTDNVHLQPQAHVALAKLAAPTVKEAIAARRD